VNIVLDKKEIKRRKKKNGAPLLLKIRRRFLELVVA
jgi:hypothetical protein